MLARRFALVALFAILPSCGDTLTPSAVATAPSAASTASGSPTAVASATQPAPPPLDADAFDPSDVAPVLADPRLAKVAEQVDAEHYAKAAALLAAALAATPGPNAEERRAWTYQLGRLRALGGDPGGAAKAFRESAEPAWALSDYAHLAAAQWLVGVGQFDDALAEAKRVAPNPATAGALDLVTADALAGKNDMDGAFASWRSYLARDKHPAQWVTVTLRLASALLQRPSDAHAEEAFLLARRIVTEAPGGNGSGAAKELAKEALATLPHKRRKGLESPPSDEQLAQAKALVASAQPREALALVGRLLKLSKAKKPGRFGCDAYVVKAEAQRALRKRPDSANAWVSAFTACAHEARRPEVLFSGARALAHAGRTVEAIARYAELERDFPEHRLADDARLNGARLVLDTGDEERFAQMLSTMPDDYPAGDMVNDGLFNLALSRIEKGAWAAAVAPLERAAGRSTTRERAYFAAGRIPYFLARAHLAAGNTARGEAELAETIAAYPLTLYMAYAYARLAERDPAAAARALAAAVAKEPDTRFTVKRGAWLDDPAWVRARELARQSETKLAKAELDQLGVGARTAPRDLAWAAVFLLAKGGGITASHNLLRTANGATRPGAGELVDWLDHYPAGAWRAPWELAYPRPYAALVTAEAKRQKIPEALAHAIMREESAFEARVVSPAKAFGLMQLIVPTAKKMAEPLHLPSDEESLKRPEVNIPLGCRFLGILRGQFPDNPLLAIPGYNAGPGKPQQWIAERGTQDFDLWVERIPYDETRLYTKRVITSLAAYEFLYGGGAPGEALNSPLAASPAARSAELATAR